MSQCRRSLVPPPPPPRLKKKSLSTCLVSYSLIIQILPSIIHGVHLLFMWLRLLFRRVAVSSNPVPTFFFFQTAFYIYFFRHHYLFIFNTDFVFLCFTYFYTVFFKLSFPPSHVISSITLSCHLYYRYFFIHHFSISSLLVYRSCYHSLHHQYYSL